jgi:hypothetical protein
MLQSLDLRIAKLGEAMLHVGNINGEHALMIQARYARLYLSPTGGRHARADDVTPLDDGPRSTRRGNRIPIIAALISAIGVVVAAIVAGAFAIRHD